MRIFVCFAALCLLSAVTGSAQMPGGGNSAPSVSQEGKAQQGLKLDVATNAVESSGKDLAAVMRIALDEERKSRDQLLGEL